MSTVELRIELPAYSHSFTLNLPATASIRHLKQQIETSCPGAPRPDSQRLIWRGRLLQDHIILQDIWQSPDEPRVVLLAVHPSGWSGEPPAIAQPEPQVPSTPDQSPFQPPPLVQPAVSPPGPRLTGSVTIPPALTYILWRHRSAMFALLGTHAPGDTIDADSQSAKQRAKEIVEANGYQWPSILDEDFPPLTDGGLVYERITFNEQKYLTLKNPTATPTPHQIHALKVLTYTFPLLSLPAHDTPAPSRDPQTLHTTPIPPHVNQVLAQLGLPPIRLAQDANQLPNPIQVPNQNPNPNPNLNPNPLPANANNAGPGFRALFMVAPTLLLIFRTIVLLYVFAPARKPLLGILIVGWLFYEGWQHMRNAFMRAGGAPQGRVPQAPQAPAANQPLNNPAQPQPMAQQPVGQQPIAQQGPAPVQPNRPADTVATLLEIFATINLATEDALIAPTPPDRLPLAEPSWLYKVTAFVSLLTVTVHPAVWDRRRALLATREGRIRTEDAIRTAPPDDQESEARKNAREELLRQHASRPRWVRDYIDRVVTNEWADDLD